VSNRVTYTVLVASLAAIGVWLWRVSESAPSLSPVAVGETEPALMPVELPEFAPPSIVEAVPFPPPTAPDPQLAVHTVAAAITIAVDQIASLTRRLAEALKDPNSNPELIQALEEARKQQQEVLAISMDSLDRSLTEARNNPNINPQLIQVLEQARQQQQQVLATSIDSLQRSSTEASNDPNNDRNTRNQLTLVWGNAFSQQQIVLVTSVVTDQIYGLNRSLAEARNVTNASPELIQALEDNLQQHQAWTGDPLGKASPNTYGGSVSEIEHPDGSQTRIVYNPSGTVRLVYKFDANVEGRRIYTASDPESQAINLKMSAQGVRF
jgi:hypothetical protein